MPTPPQAPPRESVTIRPEAVRWASLLRRTPGPDAQEFRVQFGLPLDRPLIMTGHQAEFWHPGILAKYIAADAAAARLGAETAWVVVDQDRAHSTTVRYPALHQDGRLDAHTLEFTTGPLPGPPGDAAAPAVSRGLERITAAMRAHAGLPTLARRIAAATTDLLRPLLPYRPAPPTIFATELHRSALFARLVDRMRREPERCCAAYNAAVARHRSAGMRPLVADEVQDRYELPLWWLPPQGPRRHVYAEMLGEIPLDQLAPRALLMTGLLRLAGCDLFIHGTGGGGAEEAAGHEGYDRVTEDWLHAWLGTEPAELAAITVVTATRLLPLPGAEPPEPMAVARTKWLAHHARHSPDVLRDAYYGDAKARLVHAVRASPKPGRARLFRQLQTLLAEYRRLHEPDLQAMHLQAVLASARLRNAAVAFDRTWAFPLYPDSLLESLRAEIIAAFSGAYALQS